MRIRILRDRNFRPNNQMTVAYKAGTECTVKREWGDALVADGDAEEIEPQNHHETTKEN
jgi:hypothetical protein